MTLIKAHLCGSMIAKEHTLLNLSMLKSHLEFMFFSGYYHICLLKSGVVKPEVCLLCDEKETLNHLFFDCVVAGKGFMLFCLQALE